ncbi:hypothetical protein C8R46DRAFT_227098 [Mycena filopes]|nr:hypothetical protein C8R46DRAFT_227098 [Mycena filopes]
MAASTESSLTEMSEEEDVVMHPPRPSAKKAYEYLHPLLEAFESTLSRLIIPSELRDEWGRTTADIKGKAVQKPYKVVILGRTADDYRHSGIWFEKQLRQTFSRRSGTTFLRGPPNISMIFPLQPCGNTFSMSSQGSVDTQNICHRIFLDVL